MWRRFQKLPLAISLPSILILMMMIPSLHGFYAGNVHQGRTFFYAVLLGLFALIFLSFSLKGAHFSAHQNTQLWSLIAFYLGFPILLAIPLHEVAESGNFINSYLDIVSTVTTTGLPIFPTSTLSETLVIWRVCLGWVSGFLIWVFAWSVFAPLNLGGFELLGSHGSASGFYTIGSTDKMRLPAEKFWREALRLAPIYFLITAATSLALLILSGDPAFAILRAMATIATFGLEIPGHSGAGWSSEAVLIVVMVFALSRATFSTPFTKTQKWYFSRDPELQVAVVLITIAVLLLFCMQWPKLNGVMGYALLESSKAHFVIGALAMFGGGVATTAGGIKLLRVYILARHCKAEVDRLIAPTQVISGQSEKLLTSHHNAMLACVFLMLFILVFAAITLGLTLTGSSVDDALLLTLATLTNTGPIAQGVGALTNTGLELGTDAKLILALAMTFGRLEVFALLALLNPDIYR